MSQAAGSALARLWHGLLAYAVKFGVVGLIGLVIDVTLFNLLRLGVFGDDHWAQSAIGAKTISTSVAIVFNWLGNRYWTFRNHRRRNYVRECLPLERVLLIAVGNDRVRDRVRAALDAVGLRTRVAVYPPWFQPTPDADEE